MANIFNSVRAPRIGRSRFNLSHDVKLTCNFGELIPVMVKETLPGDTWSIGCEALARMAPMLAPIYSDVDVKVEHFFVPKRLVWQNSKEFLTGFDKDGNPVSPVPPTLSSISAAGSAVGTILDYVGIPSGVAIPPGSVSSEPFRAYSLIWNEYYRDESVDSAIKVPLTDGNDNLSSWYPLTTVGSLKIALPLKRRWKKDYFTSALPWAQKGDPVNIPILGDLPVQANNGNGDSQLYWDGASESLEFRPTNPEDSAPVLAGGSGSSQSVTINDLREAFALQHLQELLARGGSRYIEFTKSIFGVQSSDARLQRPEMIGGSTFPLRVSEVLQTSETTSSSPQGDMTGHGLGAGATGRFKYFCEEHGWIISIMSVIPRRADYQQGLERQFTKFDKLDFGLPQLAHLGEQEIKNKEIYFTGTSNDNGTFGYQSRYAEYKTALNRICGDFRTSLNYWHLGRIFNSTPKLSPQFLEINGSNSIEGKSPLDRIFAVQDADVDKLWMYVKMDVTAKRKLPKYGTPGLLKL